VSGNSDLADDVCRQLAIGFDQDGHAVERQPHDPPVVDACRVGVGDRDDVHPGSPDWFEVESQSGMLLV
jgi:hypothetical protein